jgi:hypothetical protein
VHKFLNNFLKAKMEREMEKFKIIEQAYQKIKASTVYIILIGEIIYKCS